MWFSDKVYLVQRNLNYINLQPDLENTTNIDRACCGAASIFSHIYLRDLGFYTGIILIIVRNFRASVDTVVEEVLADVDAERADLMRLVWILVIAAISAFEKPERAWFVGKLKNLSVLRLAWSKKMVKEVLLKILWTKDWDQRFDVLWEEIMHT
jgi:hypothetical protein